jgi:hypothetical protein
MTNDEETNIEEEFERAWSEGTPVELDTSKSAKTTVLSVRVPRELLYDISQLAVSQGKAPGTFARELIESALAANYPASPALLGTVLARLLELQARSAPVHFRIANEHIFPGAWASAGHNAVSLLSQELNVAFGELVVGSTGYSTRDARLAGKNLVLARKSA